MLFNPVQIDLLVTKRESKWILICPTCQHERIATYCQAWNVKKKKSSGDCFKCAAAQRENNAKFKKNNIPWNKGIKWKKRSSKNQIKAMEYNHLFDGIFTTKVGSIKQRKAKLGLRGKDANAWKGGLTRERTALMSQEPYKIWRTSVFIRDNYTCQNCGQCGNKLQAHHIELWSENKELRYELSNGITLCKPCHKTEHRGNK
jgi:hypothetical protein